jgi:rhamnose utilization protein RhaD (predicted bifunctional aldolase and dehydrogenase)
LFLEIPHHFFKPYFTSIEAFSSIDGPFTPDHVVYAGHALLWVDQMNRLQEALRTYRIKQGGQMPGVIAVKDVGIFFVGQNEKKARIIYLLARDMVRISLLAKAFGGVQFMPEEQTEFIRHWEVEQFRKKVT